MKKGKIVKSVIILACLAVCLLYWHTKEQKVMSNIIIDNIEALAASEGSGSPSYCFDFGDIDCHGIKVKKAIEYRLDME